MIFRPLCGNGLVSRMKARFPAGAFEIRAAIPRPIRILMPETSSGNRFPIPGGRCEKIGIRPLTLPSPRGERVNKLKLIINFLPLDGGGAGWG